MVPSALENEPLWGRRGAACSAVSGERVPSRVAAWWGGRRQVWGLQGDVGSGHTASASRLRGALWTPAERPCFCVLPGEDIFPAAWVSAHSHPCCLSQYFVLLLKQQMFSLSSKRNVLAPRLPQSGKSWRQESSSTNSAFESTGPCTLASMSASNALWKFGINVLRDYSCCRVLFIPFKRRPGCGK